MPPRTMASTTWTDWWWPQATVDEGPTVKRIQPRAMGRAFRIRKRSSHITIVLREREEA